MNRRGFLSALISAGVAAAADPERLLWTPGKKLISIPIKRIPDPYPMIRMISHYDVTQHRMINRLDIMWSLPWDDKAAPRVLCLSG